MKRIGYYVLFLACLISQQIVAGDRKPIFKDMDDFFDTISVFIETLDNEDQKQAAMDLIFKAYRYGYSRQGQPLVKEAVRTLPPVSEEETGAGEIAGV